MDDWDDSVSMRLAALALDRGRLTDDLGTALAVRGTLLVDLALRGRVRDTEEAVEFDDPPTGFPPADRLLAEGAESLTDLLRRGPVDQRDLAAVGTTLGLLAMPRERAGEELLAHIEPVRWLVDLVVEEVDRAITRGRFMRGAVGFADGTPG